MRFRTKMSLLVALALAAALTVPAPPVQAQSTGLVTFQNNLGDPLTFSVDDVGYTCRVFVVMGSCNARAAVGGHTLFARYDDGQLAASRSIDLGTDGFTWTIYEQK